MKWKLLLALSFCFSLLSPLTTTAGEPALRPPPTGGYNSPTIKNPSPPKTGNVGTGLNPANDPVYDNSKKFSKTKKIVRVGVGLKTANHIRKNKWKYIAGAVVVGGTAGFAARKYYQNDIDRVVDEYIISDLWDFQKRSKLLPILRKKIENAKPEDKQEVNIAIQQSLIRYMGFYHDHEWGKVSTSILKSLDLVTNDVIMQTNFERSQEIEAKALIDLNLDKVDKTRRRTKCQVGSPEREKIKLLQSLESGKINNLSEWDVGHYGVQGNINRKYITKYPASDRIKVHNSSDYSYTNPNQNQVLYEFEKDHIPSKLAVTTYLANRDNAGKPYDSKKIGIIHNNAISVVMKKSIHKLGRTNTNKNKKMALVDAKNLKAAMVDDFAAYYVLASKGGYNDSMYKVKWLKALIETYIENEKMCLFI